MLRTANKSALLLRGLQTGRLLAVSTRPMSFFYSSSDDESKGENWKK